MQNTNEDTEWNDVLRAKGIISPKPNEAVVTEEQIEDIVENVVKEYSSSNAKNVDEMDLEELNEVEDDLDEKIFLEYRQRRIAEMKASMKASSFGEVIEITGKDYVQEVNKAGDGIWVIVHLYKQGIPLCSLINEHAKSLAVKFPDVKFVKSLAELCIQNYPDHNLPTIFVYRNSLMKTQLIGPSAFPSSLKLDEFEWMLSETGAIKTDLEQNPRQKIKDTLLSQLGGGSRNILHRRHSESNNDSDNNDW